MTPEAVLKASGHVERFTDLMVTDRQTGDCHRADHLLEHALEALLEDTANPLSTERRKVGPQAQAPPCPSSTRGVRWPKWPSL